MFPRLCICRSPRSPAKAKDLGDFKARLDSHFPRLEAMGVDYHKPEIKIGEWKDGDVSRLWGQLWWDITPHVAGNGIYRVNFVQNAGTDEVLFQWLARTSRSPVDRAQPSQTDGSASTPPPRNLPLE
jgi:hypothetical protein